MPESGFIAIVGSADTRRKDYRPELRNVDAVEEACALLGKALADQGYGISVYSADPKYIEAHVVRGYASSDAAEADSIQIYYPGNTKEPVFPEAATKDHLFAQKPQAVKSWLVPFYTSLKEADGVLLVGGAESCFIAGLWAQLTGLPMVVVSAFGGSAGDLWSQLDGVRISKAERELMGQGSWSDSSAGKLIETLRTQRERREQEEREQEESRAAARRATVTRAALMVVLIVGALTSVVLGVVLAPWVFLLALFAVPALGGAAGGVASTLRAPQGSQVGMAKPLSLGFVAGIMSAILFALAQWATYDDFEELKQGIPIEFSLILLYEVVVGFVAGLTFERVFLTMEQTNVVKKDAIEA